MFCILGRAGGVDERLGQTESLNVKLILKVWDVLTKLPGPEGDIDAGQVQAYGQACRSFSRPRSCSMVTSTTFEVRSSNMEFPKHTIARSRNQLRVC